jgi:hypothetical protein
MHQLVFIEGADEVGAGAVLDQAVTPELDPVRLRRIKQDRKAVAGGSITPP